MTGLQFNGTRKIIFEPFVFIRKKSHAYLVETNVTSVFTETLTTDIQIVLADQTGTVSANTTKYIGISFSTSIN